MKKLALPAFAFFTLAIFTFQSCDKDKGIKGCNSDFDQTEMFANVADNIILPAYEALQQKVNELSAQSTAFVANPDATTLENAQTAFINAYMAWQSAAPFEFGPAEEVFLRSSVNNFPINELLVENNIASGDYDFDMPDAYDKGFPALDYLFFEVAVNGDSFTSNGNYGTYLLDVVADIKQRVDDTYSAWTNGYRETFVANTGTAAGTSLSLLTNQLNQHYEAIKRDKIGIPSGALTLGFTNPESVEAYYSGYSIELAVAALNSSRQLYLGNAMDGTAGIGFDDYLTEIGAEKSGIPLDEIIQQQYTATIAAVAGLANPLSATVDTDTESVVSAYNETVKQIVNIKTDMPSVLCVAITYIDNPSDSD